MKKLLLFSVLFALFSFSAEAKTLYVEGSIGNDSVIYANNSFSTPWRTIGRAAWGSTNRAAPVSAQAAQAGDTVIVNAGTYSGTGTGIRYSPLYNPVNTGTSGSPIVFQTAGTVILTQTGDGPLIGASSDPTTINYITWKGFTIIEINALARGDTGPVVLWATTGSRIEDCIIDGYDNGRLGNNHNGIRLEGAVNCVVKNNKIYNVLNNGTYHMNGSAIMTYNTTDTIIEHNEIYNCGSGIFIKGPSVAQANKNNTIRYNYIHTSSGYGIMLSTTAETHRVYQNIIRDVEQGIRLGPLVSGGLGGTIYLVNNTIINPGTGSETAGIWFTGRAGSTPTIVTQNNIIYKGSNYKGIGAWYWDNASYLGLDYNLYYNVNIWQLNASDSTSVSNWRTALGGCPNTGNECASITSNPLFVDEGAYNYKLQGGSPAINAGIDILDLNGNGSTTDRIPMGAYITGNEVIGRSVLTPPARLRVQ